MSIKNKSLVYGCVRLSLLATLIVAMSGCGEFAYKRGAGVADLQQAQSECKSKGGDQSVYEKCMSDNGWVVQKMDDIDPVAHVLPNTDNRGFTEPETAAATDKNGAPATTGQPSATADVPKKPANMMDTFVIGSWWKRGGNPDMLKADTEACVSTLGAAHQPSTNPQNGAKTVTRGLLLCLRQQGWYGLETK